MLDNTATVIQRELSSGERLVWSGQPLPGIRLRPTDAYVIPFSLVWCGFAIFWETMALTAVHKSTGVPVAVVFPLFGVPFVLIGLYFVFGRFFMDAQARARTFYGITNERIIIVSGLFSRNVKSLNLRTLTDISLTERSDDSGTINFGPVLAYGRAFPTNSWPGASRYAPPAFDLIERAKQVYDLLRQTQKAAA